MEQAPISNLLDVMLAQADGNRMEATPWSLIEYGMSLTVQMHVLRV